MRLPLCSTTAMLLGFATALSAVSADPPETVQDRAGFIPKRKHEPLQGTVIGVLVSNPQPVLSIDGRSGPGDAYCFSADGCSYRWVYVPTFESPQIVNLRVPVGLKGETQTYPALNMANPRGVIMWGVKAPYTLVRVQVNGGQGSPPNDSFVATDMKPLDGTKEFPLQTTAVIKDLKKRYAGYVKEQDRAIRDAMDAAQKKALQERQASGPRETQEVMYVTWMTKGERLRVHFRTRISDGEYKYSSGGVLKETGGLRPQPRDLPKVRFGMTFGVEFGMAYEVSKQGEVVRTEVLPYESFQQNLPPPPGNVRTGPIKKR